MGTQPSRPISDEVDDRESDRDSTLSRADDPRNAYEKQEPGASDLASLVTEHLPSLIHHDMNLDERERSSLPPLPGASQLLEPDLSQLLKGEPEDLEAELMERAALDGSYSVSEIKSDRERPDETVAPNEEYSAFNVKTDQERPDETADSVDAALLAPSGRRRSMSNRNTRSSQKATKQGTRQQKETRPRSAQKPEGQLWTPEVTDSLPSADDTAPVQGGGHDDQYSAMAIMPQAPALRQAQRSSKTRRTRGLKEPLELEHDPIVESQDAEVPTTLIRQSKRKNGGDSDAVKEMDQRKKAKVDHPPIPVTDGEPISPPDQRLEVWLYRSRDGMSPVNITLPKNGRPLLSQSTSDTSEPIVYDSYQSGRGQVATEDSQMGGNHGQNLTDTESAALPDRSTDVDNVLIDTDEPSVPLSAPKPSLPSPTQPMASPSSRSQGDGSVLWDDSFSPASTSSTAQPPRMSRRLLKLGWKPLSSATAASKVPSQGNPEDVSGNAARRPAANSPVRLVPKRKSSQASQDNRGNAVKSGPQQTSSASSSEKDEGVANTSAATSALTQKLARRPKDGKGSPVPGSASSPGDILDAETPDHEQGGQNSLEDAQLSDVVVPSNDETLVQNQAHSTEETSNRSVSTAQVPSTRRRSKRQPKVPYSQRTEEEQAGKTPARVTHQSAASPKASDAMQSGDVSESPAARLKAGKVPVVTATPSQSSHRRRSKANRVVATPQIRGGGSQLSPAGTELSRRESTASSQVPQAYNSGPLSIEEESQVLETVEKFQLDRALSNEEIIKVVHTNPKSGEEIHTSFWNAVQKGCPTRKRQKLIDWCRKRYHNYVGRGIWTQEQDEELRRQVEKHGQKWTAVAKEINRHPDDVRDRYRNYASCGDKQNKDYWRPDEEERLREVVSQCLKAIDTVRRQTPNDMDQRSNEECLDWAIVSKKMDKTRSGRQCLGKWRMLKASDEIGPCAENLSPNSSWRHDRARKELRTMTPEDKFALICAIRKSGARTDAGIPWGDVQSSFGGSNFQRATLIVCWGRLRRAVPAWEIKTTAICAEHLYQMYKSDGVADVAMDDDAIDEADEKRTLIAMTPDPARRQRGRQAGLASASRSADRARHYRTPRDIYSSPSLAVVGSAPVGRPRVQVHQATVSGSQPSLFRRLNAQSRLDDTSGSPSVSAAASKVKSNTSSGAVPKTAQSKLPQSPAIVKKTQPSRGKSTTKILSAERIAPGESDSEAQDIVQDGVDDDEESVDLSVEEPQPVSATNQQTVIKPSTPQSLLDKDPILRSAFRGRTYGGSAAKRKVNDSTGSTSGLRSSQKRPQPESSEDEIDEAPQVKRQRHVPSQNPAVESNKPTAKQNLPTKALMNGTPPSAQSRPVEQDQRSPASKVAFQSASLNSAQIEDNASGSESDNESIPESILQEPAKPHIAKEPASVEEDSDDSSSSKSSSNDSEAEAGGLQGIAQVDGKDEPDVVKPTSNNMPAVPDSSSSSDDSSSDSSSGEENEAGSGSDVESTPKAVPNAPQAIQPTSGSQLKDEDVRMGSKNGVIKKTAIASASESESGSGAASEDDTDSESNFDDMDDIPARLPSRVASLLDAQASSTDESHSEEEQSEREQQDEAGDSEFEGFDGDQVVAGAFASDSD